MNLHNKVLPKDKRLAIKIYKCCYEYLNNAKTAFKKDELEKADWWIIEYQRCRRDLDSLIDKKKIHEHRARFIQKLLNDGHKVEMINWKGRNNHA